MKIPNEENFKEEIIRGTCYGYGDYLCSYDNKTVLNSWFYFVGYDDDEEGYHWRSFCPENWEKVKDMSNEEIYSKFEASTTAQPDVEHKEVEVLYSPRQWDKLTNPIYGLF